jgi:hypothetical protein
MLQVFSSSYDQCLKLFSSSYSVIVRCNLMAPVSCNSVTDVLLGIHCGLFIFVDQKNGEVSLLSTCKVRSFLDCPELDEFLLQFHVLRTEAQTNKFCHSNNKFTNSGCASFCSLSRENENGFQRN